MEAGRLRNRVTIAEKSVTRDTYGGEVITWTTVTTVWAEVAPMVGREYLEGRQEGAEITTKIRMRYVSGVLPQMRASFTDDDGTHVYDIQAVQHVEMRKREVVLMCREQV